MKDWCKICTSHQGPPPPPPRKLRAPMHQYNVGAPAERIALNVLGPLPTAESGNKYDLLVGNYFTKWPEAYSLPNQEAITIAEVLVKEYICHFGVPLEIHSDQGRNFESNVFQEMCSLLGIRKIRTTPLHPQSDGMVERINRTLEAQLSKPVDEHQCNWDHYIPFLMMALRSATHETNKCSPSSYSLATSCGYQSTYSLGDQKKQQLPPTTVSFYNSGWRKISTARAKSYYDLRADDNTFIEGDAVWVHNPRKKVRHSPKLMRPWEGAYTKFSMMLHVYQIQPTPRSKAKVVHRNRLWKYAGATPPNWTTLKSIQRGGPQ